MTTDASTEAEKTEEAAEDAPQIDWKAEARKWEGLAKKNKDAAAELKALKESQMSEAEKLQTQLTEANAQLEALKAERDRAAWAAKAAQETGVPLSILSRIAASSEEEMAAIAAEIAEEIKPRVLVDNDGKTPSSPAPSARDAFRMALQTFDK